MKKNKPACAFRRDPTASDESWKDYFLIRPLESAEKGKALQLAWKVFCELESRSPIHRHVFRLLAVFSLPPVWEDPGTSQQCIFFDAEDHICRDEHYFQLETDISRLPAGRSRGSLMIPFPGHGLRQSCCGSVVRPKVNRSL